ncbi:MAG: nuclear transport factor 2 family protein [Bauldia sp.]|nr:nuclear transport factor 2 family protein [Bauldia sp.]
MTDARQLAFPMRAAIAARVSFLALLTILALALARPVLAADLDAEGKAAVQAWVDAVVSGDVDRIGAILAPEFQILRADGSAYDKDEYLQSILPRFPENGPEMSDLVVTGEGEIMVTRYVLTTGGVRGDEAEPEAPRLTVFRKDGDAWLVVAHANFGLIAK